MCFLRGRVCGDLTQLNAVRTLAVLAALASIGTAASAATPAPTPPVRINITKAQPKSILPKVPLHTEYTVEVNKLGQVTKVRSVKPCKDLSFNAKTYGNVLQAFIRTESGGAISGVYRMSYDYSPVHGGVKRSVNLLQTGGVDANAEGAALAMERKAARRAELDAQKQKTTALPDLKDITKSTPRPKPTP